MEFGKVLDKLDASFRHMVDGAAATLAIGGVLFDNMNLVVLVLTGIWTFIRIWETETVKRITGRSEDKDE